jgi:hypothetical protein
MIQTMENIFNILSRSISVIRMAFSHKILPENEDIIPRPKQTSQLQCTFFTL